MNWNLKMRLLAASVMLCARVHAAEPAPLVQPAVSTPVVASSALPAMSFYGSIASDELFDIIKKSDQFVRLDKELFGSPLHLRVMHSLQPTPGGKATGLLSAILTGG